MVGGNHCYQAVSKSNTKTIDTVEFGITKLGGKNMKTEYRKGLEQGLSIAELILKGIEKGNMTVETAYEILRDEQNLTQEQ